MKRIGKIVTLCLVALVVCLSGALVACKPKGGAPITPPEEGLTLNRSTVELDLHEEIQLTVVDEGDGAISWNSGDNAVATVTDGLVRSVAAGTTVITAYRDNKSGTCTVTVVNSFTAPIITFGDATVTTDKNAQKHIAASVLYKGNPVADAGELAFTIEDVYNYEGNTEKVASMVVDGDKKGATLSFGTYGEAELTASAVVWGIPIESTLPIKVVNPTVSISSAITEKNGDNYAVSVNPIGVDYKEQRVSENTVDPQLTVTENGQPVSNPQWRVIDETDKHVAHFDTASGKIVADDACDIDTETLILICNGNSVKFDVTTEKAEIALTETDKWDMELRDKTEIEVGINNLNTQLSGIDIEGAIEKVEIPHKVISENNGNMSVDNTQRNIFKSFDSGTQTVTLTPPVQAYNMGDMTATVTTTKAIYLVPVGIYTLKISDEDELDDFKRYTTHQWSDPYLWDGYFVLDDDITYNQNLTEVTSTTRAFTPFIWAEKRTPNADGGYERYFDAECTVNVNKWNTGFIGVFDGRGHTIDGFVVDASSGEKYRNEHESTIPNDQKTHTEWGGFIGKLGAAAFGDNLRRGTIKNISFTNAVHGGGAKGTWGGFLYSMSLGGRIENVYIQSKMIGSNGFFGGTEWLVQSSAMRNVVLDVVSESNWNADYALGTVHNWSSADFAYLQNLYTVRPTKYSLNLPADIKNTKNTPRDAFANKQALGDYLADNGLLVSAANGWDMDFWTTDTHGAPIPKSLVGTGTSITTLAMSTVSVQTFDGFKPHTYGWNVGSDTAVTFASSNDNVVTVSPEGVLVAVGRGEATVTATPAEGTAKTLTVTVTDAYEGAKGFVDHIAIASVAEIERLAAETNTSGKKYVLANDIDLNGRVGSIAHDFKGVFHGNGYALKNGKLMVMPSSNDDNVLSANNKKQAIFSGKPNGATIRNLKLIGWEIVPNTTENLTANGTGWWYVGVINNPQWCTLENLYVQLTVSADGSDDPYDAPFGQPSNSTFRNILVDITYTAKHTKYATLFTGTWAGNVTVTDVYAIVHAPADTTINGDEAEIKDTLGNNSDNSQHMPTSSARNYASLDALRTAHGECFAAGGAFTGAFWDGILQA